MYIKFHTVSFQNKNHARNICRIKRIIFINLNYVSAEREGTDIFYERLQLMTIT